MKTVFFSAMEDNEVLSAEQIDLLLTHISSTDDPDFDKKMREAEERAKLTRNAKITLVLSWADADFLKKMLKYDDGSYTLKKIANMLEKATQAVLDGKGDQTVVVDRFNMKGEMTL